jgi:hypothetical protein
MPNIRQKSTPARIAFSLFLALVALSLAVAAPTAALAAPEEPPNLVVEPGSYDFGLQPVYSGSQAGFQLRNDGAEAIQLEPSQIVGDSEAFWVNDCGWKMLQPSETCFAQVYFNPQHPGDFSAELRANANGYQFSATLSGEGGQAVLAPESSPVDFGVAKVGAAGVTREIAVANVGNMTGGVFIAVVSGGAVGSYKLLDESCTGIPLAPAATCTLQVRFQPLSEGVKKATLSLFGESDGGTQIVLSGVGAAPEPVSDPPADAAIGAAASSGAAALAAPAVRGHGPKARKRKRRPRIQRRSRRAGVAAARLIAVAG